MHFASTLFPFASANSWRKGWTRSVCPQRAIWTSWYCLKVAADVLQYITRLVLWAVAGLTSLRPSDACMRHQLRPPVIQILDMENIDKQWLMKLLQKTYTVKALISRPIKNDCVMQTDVFPYMSCKTLSNSNLFYMILKIMCKKCHSKSLLFNIQWYVYQLVYVSQAKEIHSITMTMFLVFDDLLINNNGFFLCIGLTILWWNYLVWTPS